MRLKRILSLGLAAALMCSLLVLPLPAMAAGASFGDIADSDMAEAAETLKALGIVDGVGSGSFVPAGILTRAQFAKMAVELMGKGDLVAGQMNRTVFKDVPATHWARGYINVATQASFTAGDKDVPSVTTPGIIRGDAYGNFNPDKPITYAEAVTILVRILGYSDTDVGLMWPEGYLSMADSLKLTEGVDLKAGDALNRGQAVLLLHNLLFINPKDSKTKYLAGSALNCTITDETIVYAVDAVAPDGSRNAVKAADSKLYKTDRPAFPEDLVGRRVKLVLDADGKAVAAQPSEAGTQKVVGILSTGYNFLKGSDGAEVSVSEPAKVKVYRDGQEESTFDKAYLSLFPGAQAVLQYSAAGELEYVFLRTGAKTDTGTTVLKNKPVPPVSEPSYQIYKNGIPATSKDLRQYDVTTFDQVSNTMYVSDLRLTGIYEDVYPSPATPATITVLGRKFPVLQSAARDLASFKPGQRLTLLLSHTGQVAGAVAPGVASSTAVGQIKSVDANGNAVVTAINLKDTSGQGMELSGKTAYTGDRAAEMVGQLVTVTSASQGYLSLSKLGGNQAGGAYDVGAGKVGSVALATNVRYYEHVEASTMKEVEKKDITVASVPTQKISYIHKNYAGDIDIVVFNGVTGDVYSYGTAKYTEGYDILNADKEVIGYVPSTLSVTNALGSTKAFNTALEITKKRGMVGIVEKPGADTLAGYVALKEIPGIKSTAFDLETMTVTTPDAIYPIASNVMCYNEATNLWFPVGGSPDDDAYKEALNLARAFSDKVTLYLDKAPEDGGKVRIVTVG